ncbi:MAG TPA: IclR family transcriptional regulator [Hyphomonadaceae bacterium]|nr:IclR family transcriptional regulator [Hyphomonadaceae bacterium]
MHRDPIKSAARTLKVLELFQEQRQPLNLTYIFEKLGYPQSSTTTLLKSMVVLGYLNYDRASRTYFPTTRVAALGDWINHHLFGAGDIDRLIATIFEQTNETVVISSQNDIFIQHLRILQPSHPHKIAMTEGSMRALPHSAAGLVLMSQMPRKTVDKLCRHVNAYLGGAAGRIDIPQLQTQLEWIKREGYSLLAAFPFPNAAAMAMPLPPTPHGVRLTLGVGGLNSRIARKKTEILDIMRAGIADYKRGLDRAGVADEPVANEVDE